MKPANSIILIEIDGQRFEVKPDDLFMPDNRKNNVFELSYQGKQNEVRVLDIDQFSHRCIISIDGQVKEVKLIREIDVMIEKMGLTASHSRKESIVYAPMPGLVSSIRITEGQQVEKGAPLIILEAMKMENVISAPHDAVVKDIKISIGQAVERGTPLVEFS